MKLEPKHIMNTPETQFTGIPWTNVVNGEAETIALFPGGKTLRFHATGGGGTLTHPRNGDVGTFLFPIRNARDAFHALLLGKPLPDHCKGW
jgi:hypothetical protein